MKLKQKIGFIGFGKMGSALASGAVSSGVVAPTRIRVFDANPKLKARVQKRRLKWAPTIKHLIQTSQLIFICVKPQQMTDVFEEVSDFRRDPKILTKCFVSIAAGIPISRLQDGLGKRVPVIRVMPNTPALLRSGMSALSRGRYAKQNHERQVQTLLTSVGQVVSVPESAMHLVTALSGSGPAYGFYLGEALIESAVHLGLKRGLAQTLVHQTLYGAGRMLKEQSESAAELRAHVTSPGGTTAAAIAEFERQRFKKMVHEAIKRAVSRSKELAKIY